MFAVVIEWLGLSRVNDQGSVQSSLFLEPGVTVVPVRPSLTNVESVDVCFAWSYAVKLRPGTPSMFAGSRMPCQ
jgi:hypothetical protein